MSENNATSGNAIERDKCWFLGCTNSPQGRAYREGDSVECCESHGELAASHAWDRYVPVESDTDA